MSPLMAYLIKAGMIYMLCFILYWLLFRRETFFRRNRIFLLTSLVLPALVPLVRLPVGPETGSLASTPGIRWMVVINSAMSQEHTPESAPVPYGAFDQGQALRTGTILISIYIAGLIFFLARMLYNYAGIINLIARSERRRLQSMILAITSGKVSPFSIFRWLVIPKSRVNHPDLDKIIQHEMIHYRQKHSVDLLLTELLIVFQWFNPFAWLLKSAVVNNNEFLVDQILINGSLDQKEYQYALLNTSVGEHKLALVNGFNKSLIKKRIKMMNKRKTRLVNRAKEIVIIPFALILILAFSAYTNKATVVDQDQDRKIVKKEETKDQRKIVKEDTWTVTKKEERKIVGDDTWTNPQDQDKDKKKKAEGEKGHITIMVDGEMIKIKDYTDDGSEGHIKIIKLSELDDLELGEDIDRKELFEKLKEFETDGEKTLLLIKESQKDGRKYNAYVGAMVNTKSDDGGEGVIYIKKGSDGDLSVYTSEDEGGSIYVTEGDSKKVNFHIKADGKNKKDYIIVIDGEVSDEEALNNLDSDKIYSIAILDSEGAKKEFGDKARDGVIKVTTKK